MAKHYEEEARLNHDSLILEAACKMNFEFASLKIGPYLISKSTLNPDHISICHESGEGGDFSAKKFEKAIAKFFNDNF